MLKQLINFYKVSSPRPCNGEALSSSGSQHLHSDARRLKYLKWSTFLSATFGYGMYYVCRLSLNVVKKPIVDEGIFSETELGIIGSVLFFTYANFLIMNDVILYPTYNQPVNDKKAGEVLQQAFPNHQIIGIDCRALIKQHGSLHCVTMQYPLGVIKES